MVLISNCLMHTWAMTHYNCCTHLVRSGNLGDVRTVEVVQAVNVLHHALAVGLDGRQDEEVLQVLVLREVRSLFFERNQKKIKTAGREG